MWLFLPAVGWFGTLDPEMGDLEWTEEATILIQAAGPLTQLTVVDCHV